MSKLERAIPVDLVQSEDELKLSGLMKNSLDGDAVSYRLLLQEVKMLLTPFVANLLKKFGLGASGGSEDVMQDILLGIHLKRATYDVNQFFIPWMYAIARYKAIDYLRRNKVAFKSVSIEETYEEFEISQTTETNNGLDLLDIETLCEKLPSKQRELLRLVKVEGLSMNEVSLKTGFSISDIKVTVHRAIKELQKQVKENSHEN